MKDLVKKSKTIKRYTRLSSDHLTRYAMYKNIRKYIALRETNQCALSISNSQKLARLLGFSDNQIINTTYPSANLLALEYDDNSFDAIVSDQVLEHVNGNPFDAVRETFRILKPGGIALHTTCMLNPIHMAPNDFFRFTRYGLQIMFSPYADTLEVNEWGNAWALFAIKLGLRRIKIPHGRFHPLNRLATNNDTNWPIVTWVYATKQI